MPPPPLGIADQREHRAGEPGAVAGLDAEARAVRDEGLRQSARQARHHGDGARLRLHGYTAEGLRVERRHREDVEGRIKRGRIGLPAEETVAAPVRRARDPRPQGRGVLAIAHPQHARGRVRLPGSRCTASSQREDALGLDHPADITDDDIRSRRYRDAPWCSPSRRRKVGSARCRSGYRERRRAPRSFPGAGSPPGGIGIPG